MRILLFFLIAGLLAPFVHAADEADIVIYGGASGGIAAGVQAARMGKSVIILEPSQHVGGLTTGGLGATDIGNKRAIGGLAREFYKRVWRHYENEAVWRHQKRDDYITRHRYLAGPDEKTMWTFEPHAAAQIFREMLAEAKLTVLTGQRLDLRNGVRKEGTRIVSITMENGRTFTGKMFIDATYEGDLMAKAGVSYHVGREANSVYGETLNGVQVKNATKHQFVKPLDPWRVPGDPKSGLLPGIESDPPEPDGAGDHRVQAYNFRLCTTDVPENRVPWPKPANYDPSLYELLLRNFEAGDHRVPWSPIMMPNRKTDTNNNFAVSTDFIGQNYRYAEADYAERERIIQAHKDYTQGLMWTLANSERVPEKVRAEFQKWGLAKDEFTENGNWPTQLYVREARRMISSYVMTEKNCRRLEVVPDSVGMGAYNMDSHHVRRHLSPEGHVVNEGDVQVGVKPYPISWRSIIPKAEECSNLLVPVCLSASHIAYGSIRMEPVFMVLGQSAATGAALALDAGVSPHELDYARLKERLLADGQVLDFEVEAPAAK